ncbi:MAG: hypothetical protein P1P84_11330 [Deferrisomatales bacterium]|nr:hypothetical protein [Deferrisomatales bacterium]
MGSLLGPESVVRVGLDDPDVRGAAVALPDRGDWVARLARGAEGGAFDPAALAEAPPEVLGYRAIWCATRYVHYGLPWDITGLRLESRDPGAGSRPWIVLVHGGSANFYEFFVTPRNAPGLGQFLAQRQNVLLVTIPGNYRPGGWTQCAEARAPQYLLDQDLPPEEVALRNAVYTNALVFAGLKDLIREHLDGDVLVVGHSTGGELAFLAAGDGDLGPRCGGRFLGWGSGGPSHWRRDWERATGRRERKLRELAAYPLVSRLRTRGAAEYARSGYVGELNPCDGATDLERSADWLAREARRRPNFKQVLQDVEHGAVVELRERFEGELRTAIAVAPGAMDGEAVVRDLLAPAPEPVVPWARMAWVVGRADRGHWNEGAEHLARERFVRDRFATSWPGVSAKVLLIDAPLTHYGHVEAPAALASILHRAVAWLVA